MENWKYLANNTIDYHKTTLEGTCGIVKNSLFLQMEAKFEEGWEISF